MEEALSIDPKTSALLVMDFQRAIVDGYATDQPALLARTAALLRAARAADMLVVYIVVGFRTGYPEVSMRNQAFRAFREHGLFAQGDLGTVIDPTVAPEPGDVIITKHRTGAFSDTELELVLRSNDVTTLVLSGISTSGVVLSTVRRAADADYRLIVAEDCCSDRDVELHRTLFAKVFPHQATIATGAAIANALGAKRSTHT